MLHIAAQPKPKRKEGPIVSHLTSVLLLYLFNFRSYNIQYCGRFSQLLIFLYYHGSTYLHNNAQLFGTNCRIAARTETGLLLPVGLDN